MPGFRLTWVCVNVSSVSAACQCHCQCHPLCPPCHLQTWPRSSDKEHVINDVTETQLSISAIRTSTTCKYIRSKLQV